MVDERKKAIRKAAYSFREKCNISRYGTIDLFKECERCEYRLFRYPNKQTNNLGFATKRDNEIVIYTNSASRLSREIFTLAHEIGHVVLHLDLEKQFVDSKDTIFNNSTDEKEIEANYFAVCLLMPKEEIQKFIDLELENFADEGLSAMDIARIMTEFNVSFDMTINTLANIGIISTETKNKLADIKNERRVGNLLKSVGGNAALNKASNVIQIPHEYLEYAIYNYNQRAIPKQTLKRILEYYHLDIEDISDRLVIDEEDEDNDDLLDLIGGIRD